MLNSKIRKFTLWGFLIMLIIVISYKTRKSQKGKKVFKQNTFRTQHEASIKIKNKHLSDFEITDSIYEDGDFGIVKIVNDKEDTLFWYNETLLFNCYEKNEDVMWLLDEISTKEFHFDNINVNVEPKIEYHFSGNKFSDFRIYKSTFLQFKKDNDWSANKVSFGFFWTENRDSIRAEVSGFLNKGEIYNRNSFLLDQFRNEYGGDDNVQYRIDGKLYPPIVNEHKVVFLEKD